MTAAAIPDDQAGAILARAAAGDEASFTRLVAAHHADMRRVAYVVCHDAEMAEDACQQALADLGAAAFQHSGTGQGPVLAGRHRRERGAQARSAPAPQDRPEANVRLISDARADVSHAIDQADLRARSVGSAPTIGCLSRCATSPNSI